MDPGMRRVSDDARLLALYLLTCEHRRAEGLFRLPKAYMLEDLGWVPERLAKPFAELLENGFLAYDDDAQVVLIRRALKYQAPENDSQVTAALRHLDDLPDTPLTSEFQRLAERFCERLAKRLPEGFGEGYGHPLPPSLPLPPAPTLPSVTDIGRMPGEKEQDSQTGRGREGKASRPPRTPRHPTDEFVIQRAREIQAQDGPDAAKAYLRKVGENYGQASREDQLRRLEAIIAQDAAEAGSP